MHKYDKDGFLEDLGRRVRRFRVETGRSIQELARLAGLSPRFLSDVETGRGNISVARLVRIASTLEQPVHALLPSSPEDGSLRARIWELLQHCGTEELDELYQQLSSQQHRSVIRSIALVGVRGAGKSTIGKMLAARMHIRFVESDAMIEQQAGISLMELFSIHGESYYRTLQREVLEKFLGNSPPVVLATGGSLVTDRETWGVVRRHCYTVWLKARPSDHWNRVVAQGDMRPIASSPSAMDELKALLKSREPLYAQSDLVVDTSKLTPQESVGMILKRLQPTIKSEDAAPKNKITAGSRVK